MPKFARPNAYMGIQGNQQKTGEGRFATATEAAAGTAEDLIISPSTLDSAIATLLPDATTAVKGKIRIATDAEAILGTSQVIAMTPHTVGLIAIAGAPLASEILAGIAELATQAETIAYADDARIVTPLKLGQALAAPAAIGTATPAAGSFTALDATGVGTGNILTSDTGSSFSVTGALADVTINSAAGRAIINGEEAAANAITLLSAAGGIDVDAALAINIATSEAAATALTLAASAGGIDITAAGGAGLDVDITNAAGSINLAASEAIATAVTIGAPAGGIDITSAGAGLDVDITATGGSINLSATQNAADAITITSTAGGIDISCVGTAAEDIDITATGSSVNLLSTEDAAQSIYLRANGGVTETVDIRASQGTGAASVSLLSTAGGVTINGGLATADAINITCGNVGGGIDIDAGTAGVIVDTTGEISLDATAASNFTATGAFDITLSSTAGSMIISGGEAVADAVNIDAAAGGLDVDVALQMNLTSSQAAATAVRIFASNAAGGIDVDCGTGGIAIDSTGAISLDGAAASNFTVGGAGIDLSLISTLGSVVVRASEAIATAIIIDAPAGGVDITAVGATMDVDISSTGGSVNVTATEAIADAIVLTASAGGIDLAATGAAGLDVDISNTGGSVNITATEAIATAVVITASAGGIDLSATGAAGLDIDIVNTGGSVNVTATENVATAIVINASGAASGASIDAGTAGLTIGTGLILAYTDVATAATPYSALGTDYYIGTDTTGGALNVVLPAVPAIGRTYVIADVTGQAAIGGNITITGTAGNIVAAGASAPTYVLNTAYESLSVTWNGTIWSGRAVV
jgi:hypothetical protein